MRPEPSEPVWFELTGDERAQVGELLADLGADHDSAASTAFLRDAAVARDRIPPRLRRFLADFRSSERSAACVVSGLPVDDAAIGPTPPRWSLQAVPRSTLREEMWLVLCASALGDLFGWATQQDGALIHDICPTPGYEHSQLGSGSTELLWWHTEDAFHPLRCDYLGLLSLRNVDLVPTTFATVPTGHLSAETLRLLFEPRFVIRPDDSHLEASGPDRQSAGEPSDLAKAAHERIARMEEQPTLVPAMYGHPDSPYLSIDPFYMRVPPGDTAAADALEEVCRALDAGLRDVVLRPGEALFIDNYRAVHGRKPFRARYDGTDRWLKRVNVTRDLRKSRRFRSSVESRIIY